MRCKSCQHSSVPISQNISSGGWDLEGSGIPSCSHHPARLEPGGKPLLLQEVQNWGGKFCWGIEELSTDGWVRLEKPSQTGSSCAPSPPCPGIPWTPPGMGIGLQCPTKPARKSPPLNYSHFQGKKKVVFSLLKSSKFVVNKKRPD